MGKKQLNAVNMTREGCGVKRRPSHRGGEMLQILDKNTRFTLKLRTDLSFASLQPVMSDPMASSSSDAQGSWSLTLCETRKR